MIILSQTELTVQSCYTLKDWIKNGFQHIASAHWGYNTTEASTRNLTLNYLAIGIQQEDSFIYYRGDLLNSIVYKKYDVVLDVVNLVFRIASKCVSKRQTILMYDLCDLNLYRSARVMRQFSPRSSVFCSDVLGGLMFISKT